MPPRLSQDAKRVAALVAIGHSDKEITTKLGISDSRIKALLYHEIYPKFAIHGWGNNRVRFALAWLKASIVTLSEIPAAPTI